MHTAALTDDLELVTDIMTDAFSGPDPVVSWMIPQDIPRRERYVRGFMRTWIEFMLDHDGFALVTSDHCGAMVAEPANPVTAAELERFHTAIGDATGPAAARCLDLIRLLDARYPQDLPPHLHVALAGVRPAAQGKGGVFALTEEIVRYCVEARREIYCEASSKRNSALWQRLAGLKPLGDDIVIPETEVALYPLFSRLPFDAKQPE
ncbi:hypothetical protein Misp01_76610 [Microtetraspora sp. NBRC 13810]|nr:hypothetical protein Misp01_76610 [Microtetraspora sp. NBRC 13810]